MHITKHIFITSTVTRWKKADSKLTSSLPKRMSTYGSRLESWSLKAVQRNGADKFIVNRRSWAAANLPTCNIASGHTVIGKPWYTKHHKPWLQISLQNMWTNCIKMLTLNNAQRSTCLSVLSSDNHNSHSIGLSVSNTRQPQFSFYWPQCLEHPTTTILILLASVFSAQTPTIPTQLPYENITSCWKPSVHWLHLWQIHTSYLANTYQYGPNLVYCELCLSFSAFCKIIKTTLNHISRSSVTMLGKRHSGRDQRQWTEHQTQQQWVSTHCHVEVVSFLH